MKKNKKVKLFNENVNKNKRNETVIEILRQLNKYQENGIEIKFNKNEMNMLDVTIIYNENYKKRLVEDKFNRIKIEEYKENYYPEWMTWDLINDKEMILEQF